VSGEDLVGVPVEVLAGAVVAHRGLRVGVSGGDLYIAEADSRVQHGRDERMAQHVRVHPWHPDPGRRGQLLEAAGRGMPVHSPTQRVTQYRPVLAITDGVLDGSSDRRRQRDQHDLVALAVNLQDAVAVFLAEVGDVRPAGLEDSQSEQAEHRDQSEVIAVG
ncbi:hypothetical protein OWR29_47670, partial [Actinoplanes sp. Pm04-4]